MKSATRAGLIVSALVLSVGSIAAAPATASPAAAPVGAAAASACPYSGPHPTLSYGSTGPAVKHAQCLINYYGVWVIAEDGIFGDDTYNAVLWAQRACGSTPDGIIGPKTWDCLHPDKLPNP
ncbi:peptidoglycan-binding protein [Streptomyces sp. NPDC005263]|uniref:peptidoglycan-binding domain-containing protein n=1 Tax=Streptomyces sp. NPDC005263 TaxID=3364711 RepID=UPI003699CA11